ncbi:MAG: efflux transporter permease subunit [Steroidobacteraceae bacterium]|jgi:multidrug efflux pump subunit AcrB|nr:efflux transporter permease subunit [Steroidobacteraceae bacterium]
MNLTETSLRNPAGVLVAILMVALLGVFALVKLPIQLFPNIEEPVISIFTQWRAAAPTEIESEIIEPQERALQGIRGLRSLNAFANAGSAFVNLQFAVGTDMQATMLEVISRMNQLPPLPRDAQAPQISLGEDGGNGPNNTLSWFFVQLLPGTPGPIDNYRRQIEEIFRNRVEPIPGVSNVRINFGADEELQIVFDPARAAELGIQIPRIAQVAGNADDISGGFVDIGRRQYTVRFAGRYAIDQFEDLVLEWRDGRPVRLGDVATVQVRRGDRTNLAMQNGNPAIGIQIMREPDANVLDTLTAVKAEIELMREDDLKKLGLSIAQSFDPAVFINQAIDMVTGNLFAGILLAVAVLWYFVRDRRATLLVGLSIPICLTVTLVMLYVFDRTLNVISLAGLAFGVGQSLDTAIVMLEAIAQQRERGLNRIDATLAGAKQVWPALLASTVTAVIVFLPIVFMQDAVSQLFADLALTISIAVIASLIVAVTVLPLAASRWLDAENIHKGSNERYAAVARRIVAWTDSSRRRHATVAVLFLAPIVLTWVLLPPLDYLPPVKRDAIDGFIQLPPGTNIDTIENEFVKPVADRLAPYMAGEKEPRLKNYYVLAGPFGTNIGVRPLDPDHIDELNTLVNETVLAGFPDVQSFASQGNLFGGFGDGRNIDFQLQATNFEQLLVAARAAEKLIQQKMPGAQVQAFQDLEMADPELRLNPYDRRLNEVGWSRGDIGTVVRALGDGMFVGEYFDGERRLDMILRASKWDSPEQLASTPVATPAGNVMPLGELVQVESTVGAGGLRRVDGRRTIGLNVSPPRDMSLGDAVEFLKREVEPELRSQLPADGSIRYEGNAGSLREALGNMAQNLAIALIALFLLLAALFRSVKDSMYVILTIPLASFGGVLALVILRLFTPQTLDLLTMVGFVVLMGLVVNNAILLVDQARSEMREGASVRAAVESALATRTRPIMLTTLTTLFGMLPLVLVPGPGSALYRGLGTVLVGGMAVNSVFTLVLLPTLLRLIEKPATRSEAAVPLKPMEAL